LSERGFEAEASSGREIGGDHDVLGIYRAVSRIPGGVTAGSVDANLDVQSDALEYERSKLSQPNHYGGSIMEDIISKAIEPIIWVA
jgi:hypothetical protein